MFCYSIPREDKSNPHMNVIVNTEHGQRDWSVVSGKNYDSVIIAGLWRMTSCHMIQCIMCFNLSYAKRESNRSARPNTMGREFAGTEQGKGFQWE